MNILIVGAGGVASYLYPVLCKTFTPTSIALMDRDKLEKRNLDRQAFDPMYIGKYKAEALIDSFVDITEDSTIQLTAINQWFMEDADVTPYDIVICVADNHVARKNVLAACDECNRPCIIGGNEYFDSEAYIYYPANKHTDRDPRCRYPEILTDTSGNPVRCTGEAQEAHPQLAIANMSCAAKILHLLWNHLYAKADKKYQPFQLRSTQYETTSVA